MPTSGFNCISRLICLSRLKIFSLVDVTKCNKSDGKVAIFATLNFSDKTYNEFVNGKAVFDTGLTESFLPASGGDPAYLVLTKTLGSDVCDKKTVDGVQVNLNFINPKETFLRISMESLTFPAWNDHFFTIGLRRYRREDHPSVQVPSWR